MSGDDTKMVTITIDFRRKMKSIIERREEQKKDATPRTGAQQEESRVSEQTSEEIKETAK